MDPEAIAAPVSRALENEFAETKVDVPSVPPVKHLGSLGMYFRKWTGSVRPMPFFTMPQWKWNPRWYLTGFVGSFLAIALMGLFDQYGALNLAHRGIVFSMGATAVLLYAVPESPLSQPRNVVGGNVLACIVGLLFRYLTDAVASLRWLTGALAVSCSIVAMLLTNTLHPPAGALALVAATTTDPLILAQGWWMVLTPVAWGCAVMVMVAVLVDNVFFDYPQYWL